MAEHEWMRLLPKDLTEDERETLMISLVASSPVAMPQAEVEFKTNAVVEWAGMVRMQHEILGLVLAGKIDIMVHNQGLLMFRPRAEPKAGG